MKNLGPAILFFLAIDSSFTSAEEVSPNIVFIMADDLGWGDVGFHGGNVATPCLDRLASEGLELASHYVAPVCSPTRTGLMTGRCWSRFNVTSPQSERALPWNTVTLPRALKEVGYQTCIVGKWHLGSLPEEGPNEFGFDHSYGSLGGGVSPYSHGYKQGPFTKTWHRNQVRIEEQGHVTDLITKEAIEWIQSRGPSPFFLYVPFTAVHLPIKEPQEWLNRVPISIQGDVARHYAACVMHLDDSIDKILDTLDRKGVRNKTLLVFTSDNGGSTVENNDPKYPNDDCPTGKLTGNNTPWRGQKGDLYEGGTRVATIVQWLGRAKPGKVNTPVQIIDWMPTFCSIAGYKASTDLKWDGKDLSNLLTFHEPLADRSLYAVAPGWRSRSLRSGSWKLIVHGAGESEKPELYHLDLDPKESNNLASSEKAKLKEMLAGLHSMAVGDKETESRKDDIQDRVALLQPMDVSRFYSGIHHWRNLKDDSRFIQVVEGQASYRQDQVQEIVENILLFQRADGGWPKDYDMTAVLDEEQRQKVIATRDRHDSSYDNGNLHSQVDYLARAYSQLPEPSWRLACERGLDFILESQYPNGGFPQRFPNASSYHAHITFNDGVMIGILEVLQSISNGEDHFAWLDRDRRSKAKEAVNKAIDCILMCQIRVNGQQTGWCQQHDEKTLEARPARTFELASICPQETASIIEYLMGTGIRNREMISAIAAAANWLKKVRIEGERIEKILAKEEVFIRHKADFDIIVVQDAHAKPIWARHYEIGTDRPIFAGRDGIKKYSLSEIERERRTGTPWYGNWPAKVLAKYPAWDEFNQL